jgi:uncharacterized protein (DUF2235 family)
LNACQALAIDERRRQFPPTLWTSTPVAGQVLEQVWFSGVHCDVGGGYPETGLSDITLGWLMGKAENLGLKIDANVSEQYALLDARCALAQIHKSWNLLWFFPKSRTVADNSVLGNSVAIRCEHGNSYQPKNLILTNGAPADSYPAVEVVTPLPRR